ncbi:MAG: hypothetical protein MJ252_16640, partial [archaeon]|nr:hypothetical protein [archaeon]
MEEEKQSEVQGETKNVEELKNNLAPKSEEQKDGEHKPNKEGLTKKGTMSSNSQFGKNKKKRFANKKKEDSKDTLIEGLRTIFNDNAVLNKKTGMHMLSLLKLKTLFSKSGLFAKSSLTSTDVDLAFLQSAKNKSEMTFENFVQIMIYLAKKINKKTAQKDPKTAISFFIESFLNNYELYSEPDTSKNYFEKPIINSCNNRALELLFEECILGNDVIYLLNSLLPTFTELYKIYFSHEIVDDIEDKHLNDKEQSIKFDKPKLKQFSYQGLFQFCKDFDILNKKLNELNLSIYYNMVNDYPAKKLFEEFVYGPSDNEGVIHYGEDTMSKNNSCITFNKAEGSVSSNAFYGTKGKGKKGKRDKNIGRYYKLSTFIAIFYHFAILSYYKSFQLNFEEKLKDVNIVCVFLQELENTGGFTKLKKQYPQKKIENLSFVPSQKTLAYVESELFEVKKIQAPEFEEKGEFVCKKDAKLPELVDENLLQEYHNLNSESKTDFNLNKLMNLKENLIELLQNNLQGISELYVRYSRIQEKTTFNRMTVSAYLKFLRDIEAIYTPTEQAKMAIADYTKRALSKIHSGGLSASKPKDNKDKKKLKSIKEEGPQMNSSTSKFNKSSSVSKRSLSSNSSVKRMKKRKISESLATSIFNFMTNAKFYENKGETIFPKSHIVGEQTKVAAFDKDRMKDFSQNIPGKMDLFIFIKSFEPLSAKLYPGLTLNEAFQKFMNFKLINNIPRMYSSKSDDNMSVS